MLRQIKVAAVAVTLGMLSFTSASAQGMADIHTHVRIGNKICMADHFHYGSSSGHVSRKAAEAAAIQTYESFTAWEYGANWGRFALAESKSISCQNAGGWGCTLEGRPCRPASGHRGRRH